LIALIAVSAAVYAIDKPYSYKIPDQMQVSAGVRVIVPFGRGNRLSEGVVLSVQEGMDEGLKSLSSVLDEAPVLTEAQIRMAAFLRDRYFCTFYDAIKAILPAGLWFASEESLSILKTENEISSALDPNAKLVFQFMVERGGSIKKQDLSSIDLDSASLEKAVSTLKKKGILQSSIDFTRRVKDKAEQIVSLVLSAEETLEYAVRKKKSAPLQYEVLHLLCCVGSCSAKEVCYLTGATMATIRRLEKLGFLRMSVRPVFRNSLPDDVQPAKAISLNSSQSRAFEYLSQQMQMEKPGVSLLYGVTGSGKTAVYMQLIRSVLEQGKTALFLVPEISLTPQLVGLLMSHFGREVAVLHSALRVTERYDEWKRIKAGLARVVIGTRSAVFAPLQKLGLVIVDEEQEHTYKSENSPRYHAREVAIYRGSRENALVILGSATPSLETMYLAKSGIYTMVELPERYNGRNLPAVRLVDMKQELRSGNATSISSPLYEALANQIKAGKQSILFLNRRGASRYMICVECGEVLMCPRCSVSLTYHAANGRLMCHHCAHSQLVSDRCPSCNGHLKMIGTGTQRLQQELQELFPDVEIMRMDADTISVLNSHETMLDRFQKENIPILIGTQMVTKGLNFENVTLVGVVDADSMLYTDHFRSAETTFSMLTQVIGRAGRGQSSGQAIIQTMTPEHSVLRLAAEQNYNQFYNLEITLRQLQKAPPFHDIFTIMFVGMYEEQTYAAAGQFRGLLYHSLQNPTYQGLWLDLLGPSPAAVAKINNSFRFRIMLHGTNHKTIRQLIAHLIQNFSKDKISRGVTVYADINSYE